MPHMRERDIAPTERFTRLDFLLAALTFLLGLALYVRTLAPSVLFADGAEFQTLAVTLGMTHPTGYPIYLLIAKVFTWLPVGSIAYRVNLLSAVAGSLTLALVYLLVRALGGWRIAALAGPIGLGISALFWWHAVMAELYTAAAAMVAGILLCVILWRRSGHARLLFVAGILGGLGLGIHSTIALIAPGVLIYLLLTARRRVDWGAAFGGATLGVALFLAAFLFLDTLNAPVSYYNTTMRPHLSTWYPDNPHAFDTSWQRLAFLFSGLQFRDQMFGEPVAQAIPGHAGQYWSYLRGGWTRPALWLMVLGWLALALRRTSDRRIGWREAALLLLAWLGMLLFILNYTIGDIYVFYVPTYVPLAVVLGLGLSALLDAARWLLKSMMSRPVATYATGLLGAVLLLGTFWSLGAPVRASIAAGRLTLLDGMDEAAYPYPIEAPYYPYERAKTILGEVEPNAMLFLDWSQLYMVAYVANIERVRPDVTVIELSIWNGSARIPPSMRPLIEENIDKRPIYMAAIAPSLSGRYIFTAVDYEMPLYHLERQP